MMIQRIPLFLLSALPVILANCATSDEELDRRLAERERRQEERLDRMEKRSESFGRRWENMAEWEEERASRAWDRHMGRDPDSEWDF